MQAAGLPRHRADGCGHLLCREVQGLWPGLAPPLDTKVLQDAERLGLPTSVKRLSALVDPAELLRLAAGCVRAGRSRPRR